MRIDGMSNQQLAIDVDVPMYESFLDAWREAYGSYPNPGYTYNFVKNWLEYYDREPLNWARYSED